MIVFIKQALHHEIHISRVPNLWHTLKQICNQLECDFALVLLYNSRKQMILGLVWEDLTTEISAQTSRIIRYGTYHENGVSTGLEGHPRIMG